MGKDVTEKKKLGYGIYYVFSLFILAIIGCIIYIVVMQGAYIKNYKSIYLVESDDVEVENISNQTITSKDELREIFGKTETEKLLNFDNYNYGVLELDYDSCGQIDISPYITNMTKGKIFVDVSYTEKCSHCGEESMYYLVRVPKEIGYTDFKINYVKTNYAICRNKN